VRHRLAVAGAGREIFEPEAVACLHAASGGLPRVLNHLATQALLEALVRGAATVDASAARAAVEGQIFLDSPAPAWASAGGTH
jgi:type II secretory pathway predicted ATPase ExeA